MLMTFESYLRSHNALAASDAEKALLHARFLREYKQRKNAERILKSKRVELSFSLENYAELKADADQLNLSLAKYLKKLIAAYRNKRYLLTKEETLRELILALNPIADGVNMMVHTVLKDTLQQQQLTELQNYLFSLENLILSKCEPHSIESFLEAEYRRNPRYLAHIRSFLDYLETTNTTES